MKNEKNMCLTRGQRQALEEVVTATSEQEPRYRVVDGHRFRAEMEATLDKDAFDKIGDCRTKDLGKWGIVLVHGERIWHPDSVLLSTGAVLRARVMAKLSNLASGRNTLPTAHEIRYTHGLPDLATHVAELGGVQKLRRELGLDPPRDRSGSSICEHQRIRRT